MAPRAVRHDRVMNHAPSTQGYALCGDDRAVLSSGSAYLAASHHPHPYRGGLEVVWLLMSCGWPWICGHLLLGAQPWGLCRRPSCSHFSVHGPCSLTYKLTSLVKPAKARLSILDRHVPGHWASEERRGGRSAFGESSWDELSSWGWTGCFLQFAKKPSSVSSQ